MNDGYMIEGLNPDAKLKTPKKQHFLAKSELEASKSHLGSTVERQKSLRSFVSHKRQALANMLAAENSDSRNVARMKTVVEAVTEDRKELIRVKGHHEEESQWTHFPTEERKKRVKGSSNKDDRNTKKNKKGIKIFDKHVRQKESVIQVLDAGSCSSNSVVKYEFEDQKDMTDYQILRKGPTHSEDSIDCKASESWEDFVDEGNPVDSVTYFDKDSCRHKRETKLKSGKKRQLETADGLKIKQKKCKKVNGMDDAVCPASRSSETGLANLDLKLLNETISSSFKEFVSVKFSNTDAADTSKSRLNKMSCSVSNKYATTAFDIKTIQLLKSSQSQGPTLQNNNRSCVNGELLGSGSLKKGYKVIGTVRFSPNFKPSDQDCEQWDREFTNMMKCQDMDMDPGGSTEVTELNESVADGKDDKEKMGNCTASSTSDDSQASIGKTDLVKVETADVFSRRLNKTNEEGLYNDNEECISQLDFGVKKTCTIKSEFVVCGQEIVKSDGYSAQIQSWNVFASAKTSSGRTQLSGQCLRPGVVNGCTEGISFNRLNFGDGNEVNFKDLTKSKGSECQTFTCLQDAPIMHCCSFNCVQKSSCAIPQPKDDTGHILNEVLSSRCNAASQTDSVSSSSERSAGMKFGMKLELPLCFHSPVSFAVLPFIGIPIACHDSTKGPSDNLTSSFVVDKSDDCVYAPIGDLVKIPVVVETSCDLLVTLDPCSDDDGNGDDRVRNDKSSDGCSTIHPANDLSEVNMQLHPRDQFYSCSPSGSPSSLLETEVQSVLPEQFGVSSSQTPHFLDISMRAPLQINCSLSALNPDLNDGVVFEDSMRNGADQNHDQSSPLDDPSNLPRADIPGKFQSQLNSSIPSNFASKSLETGHQGHRQEHSSSDLSENDMTSASMKQLTDTTSTAHSGNGSLVKPHPARFLSGDTWSHNSGTVKNIGHNTGTQQKNVRTLNHQESVSCATSPAVGISGIQLIIQQNSKQQVQSEVLIDSSSDVQSSLGNNAEGHQIICLSDDIDLVEEVCYTTDFGGELNYCSDHQDLPVSESHESIFVNTEDHSLLGESDGMSLSDKISQVAPQLNEDAEECELKRSLVLESKCDNEEELDERLLKRCDNEKELDERLWKRCDIEKELDERPPYSVSDSECEDMVDTLESVCSDEPQNETCGVVTSNSISGAKLLPDGVEVNFCEPLNKNMVNGIHQVTVTERNENLRKDLESEADYVNIVASQEASVSISCISSDKVVCPNSADVDNSELIVNSTSSVPECVSAACPEVSLNSASVGSLNSVEFILNSSSSLNTVNCLNSSNAGNVNYSVRAQAKRGANKASKRHHLTSEPTTDAGIFHPKIRRRGQRPHKKMLSSEGPENDASTFCRKSMLGLRMSPQKRTSFQIECKKSSASLQDEKPHQNKPCKYPDNTVIDDANQQLPTDSLNITSQNSSLNKRSSKKKLGFSQTLPTGSLVWAQLGRQKYWPAIIIDCGCTDHQITKACHSWVFWFGDHKISQVHQLKLVPFVAYFCDKYSKAANEIYRLGVSEAIKEHFQRIHSGCAETDDDKNSQDWISWAVDGFKSCSESAAAPCNQVPAWVQEKVKVTVAWLQENRSREQEKELVSTAIGDMNSSSHISLDPTSATDNCLGCGSLLADSEYQHPFFNGSLCPSCRMKFCENIFYFDSDGTNSCCVICGGGGGCEAFVCDFPSCNKVFCFDCVLRLAGKDIFDEIKNCPSWSCFLCSSYDPKKHGRLNGKSDWRARLSLFFQPPNACVLLPPDVALRRPIRVLSLFDGIGTGIIVLEQLNILIDSYYACEIDQDATTVAKIRHAGKIHHLGDVRSLQFKVLDELGEIDLLIGGSPCNELSVANPARKGLGASTGLLYFEFFRILKKLQSQNQNRPFFWLYENVATMTAESRNTISRMFECEPALWDAKYFSAQRRARYFWGNIPDMHCPIQYSSKEISGNLDDSLFPTRKAKIQKIRTITTQRNSLMMDRNKEDSYPVTMENSNSNLWIPEVERIFGFPEHYTDVANLSASRRLKLLGQSWSVPVVHHLLSPLCDYFKTSSRKDITVSAKK